MLSYLRPGHITRAAELLFQLLGDQSMPADARMDHFFRSHKEMGKRDRGVVAELCYGALRQHRMIDARLGELTEGWAGYQRRITAILMIQQGLSMRALEKYVDAGMAKEVSQALHATPVSSLPPAVRYSLPDTVWDTWVAQWDETQATALAQAILVGAPVDIRVNAFKSTPEQVQASLAAADYTLSPVEGFPLALRQTTRVPLFRTDAFMNGWFEVQDAGSQALAALLPVQAGQKVTDFCAGAGGKTLALAAKMGNKGSITACDISEHRLERMRPRLARAGIGNVRIMHIQSEKDSKLKKLKGTQDAVLVDAPCSGSGTWRRNPDMKLRPLALDTLTQTQQSVLASAARLVRDGGYLVYATCSLFDAENEAVVQSFLAEHPEFSVQSAQEALVQQGYQLKDSAFTASGALQLRPDTDQTDGFFAVLLRKQAA